MEHLLLVVGVVVLTRCCYLLRMLLVVVLVLWIRLEVHLARLAEALLEEVLQLHLDSDLVLHDIQCTGANISSQIILI